MKILVFSDLHARLDNILPVIESNQFDKLIFLGDIFGYFVGSGKLLEFFSQNNLEFILGNHDLYYLREMYFEIFKKRFLNFEDKMINFNDYKIKYGAIDETINLLKTEDITFLLEKTLLKEIVIEGKKIILCHGSPYNPFNEYLYKDSDKIEQIFNDFDFDILICGHSHKSFIINNSERYIINPGSCTLPRGGLLPSYIIIETSPFSIKEFQMEQKVKYILESQYKVKSI